MKDDANVLLSFYGLFYLQPQRRPSLWCDPETRLWHKDEQLLFPVRPEVNLSPLSSGSEKVARWDNWLRYISLRVSVCGYLWKSGLLYQHSSLHSKIDINFAAVFGVEYLKWPMIRLKGSNQVTVERGSVPHADNEVVIYHQSTPDRPANSLWKKQCHVLH